MKKLKNSQLIMIGIIIILISLSLLFYNYFINKKNIIYSKMNVKIFENEMVENITTPQDEEIENNTLEQIENPIVEEPEMPITPEEPSTSITYEYIGLVEIPKINLKRGFLNIGSKYNSVDYNVTVVNTSTMPDVENGNLILAAHNGNAYNSYFGKLHKLVNGDKVYIYYNGIKYEYSVVNKYDVEKTGTVNIYRNFDKTTLTLITCKNNTNKYQIVYIAELINKSSY